MSSKDHFLLCLDLIYLLSSRTDVRQINIKIVITSTPTNQPMSLISTCVSLM